MRRGDLRGAWQVRRGAATCRVPRLAKRWCTCEEGAGGGGEKDGKGEGGGGER